MMMSSRGAFGAGFGDRGANLSPAAIAMPQ
jgi:hypothetical protein